MEWKQKEALNNTWKCTDLCANCQRTMGHWDINTNQGDQDKGIRFNTKHRWQQDAKGKIGAKHNGAQRKD